MISMAVTRLYQKPYIFEKATTKPDPEFEYPAMIIGSIMIACAKMMGITPAAFTFRGIYCLTPPYCLLPTILFAYCTGIRRVPCTRRILMTKTRKGIQSLPERQRVLPVRLIFEKVQLKVQMEAGK